MPPFEASGIPTKGLRWYVVRSQPRKEALALRQLHNQRIAAFCPMSQLGPRKTRREPQFRPFFPSYLFVQLDVERERWRSVNGTIGVIGLVGTGRTSAGRPTPLPEGFIERMQTSSATDGKLRFREPLAKGDEVRIVGGPFDTLCGILETSGDAERVTILLDILSKETRVQLSRDILVAA